MVDKPFDYETITSLYSSAGVLQNQSTYTPYNRGKILRLRDDIDRLGEILSQTGANWTGNNYNWTRGDRYSLDADRRLWLSYISDMRAACEDLATTAGIAAPTWTVTTLTELYKRGKSATISGAVLTQTGADFSGVTDSADYCYIQGGTGATTGRYLTTAHTATTLTLSGYSGDSSAGDVSFDLLLTANKPSYTKCNLKSLLTDVQTAILDIMDATGTFRYFVDSVNGDDATGDGSRNNPYQTWNKAVTQCNTVAGNIYLMNGAYTANLDIQQTGIIVQGESVDSVAVDVDYDASKYISTANDPTFKDIWFGDGTRQWNLLNYITGFLFERCVFESQQDPAGISGAANVMSATGAFRHCAFFGEKANDYGVGVNLFFTGTINIDDCLFIRLKQGCGSHSAATGTINIDNCTFDDVTTKTFGGATFNITNEHVSATDNVSNFSTLYLYDTSDLIDAASDGFDIGAYPNSPYNLKRTVTDTVTMSDAGEAMQKETASDTITMFEELTSANMNLSIDMPLFGLFESATNGDVIYLTSAMVNGYRAGKMAAHITGFTYNGASLDLSWDNAAGDSFDAHIVVDDGVTNYDNVSWWETHALNPAAVTSDTNGTRGYAIDCYLESELDSEWGDQGAFSATTPTDGVNDQKWDITLKVRVKNTVTGVWSEIVTLSKTYNFNTFEGTMYYCADNPRTVDNEYADHANYGLNTYHTLSGVDRLKYTRPDGVDWSADSRRYAYTPSFKSLYYVLLTSGAGAGVKNAYTVWQNRTYSTSLGTIDENRARATMALYPALFANYGNYNYVGDHCFADSTNFVYDGGTYNSAVPILGSATNKIRYLYLQSILLNDCLYHSSYQGFFYWMPSGELISHSVNGVGDSVDVNSDLYFQTTAPSPCGSGFYLMETNDNALGASAPPNPWAVTMGELAINVDNVTDQNVDKGQIAWWSEHGASNPPF